MTRTDVRKLAWVLRLIGYGMLGGAATLMLLGASRVSAAPQSAPVAISPAMTAPTSALPH